MESLLLDISWVLPFRNDFLTAIFNGFTLLGYPGFLMILISLCYWLYDKQIATRLVIIIILSALLNGILKDLAQNPRPDISMRMDPDVGESFGMPSGHAQIAGVLWFWLAYEIRRPWAWIGAAIIVMGICLSRIYLGVHDIEDILAGLAVAALTFFVFREAFRRKFARFGSLSVYHYLLALIILQLTLIFLWPAPGNSANVIVLGGFLIAWIVGTELESRHLKFSARPEIWAKPLAGVAGVAVLFAVLALVGRLLDGLDENISGYATVTVAGLYLTVGAPLFFKATRLHHPEH